MKKIERLQNIIYLLSQSRCSATQLAEVFEVTPRTIYRDIDALSQMKVPIISYEGLGGGYELESSYFFKTVQLTDTELMMMLLLLEVGYHLNTTDFDESIVTLKHKLLNASGKQLNMTNALEHITIDIQNIYPEKIKNGIFITVLEALQSKRMLYINYFTPLKDKWSQRKITPLHLFYESGCWYLSAYCHIRKAKRFFRLDRIDDCNLLDESILEDICELDINHNNASLEVIMDLDKGLYKLVKDDSFMKKAVILEETEKSYTISINVNEIDHIVLFAFRNTERVTVISPEEIIIEIKNKISKMKEKYL